MMDGFTLILHRELVDDIKRVDARDQWYRQHSENRRARREGRPPRDIQRICPPGELGQVLGFRIVEAAR